MLQSDPLLPASPIPPASNTPSIGPISRQPQNAEQSPSPTSVGPPSRPAPHADADPTDLQPSPVRPISASHAPLFPSRAHQPYSHPLARQPTNTTQTPNGPSHTSPPQITTSSAQHSPVSINQTSNFQDDPPLASPPPPLSTHPMTTRSKSGIFKPKPQFNFSAFSLSPIPVSYRQALSDPNWKSAMDSEIEALHWNATWDLVPCPPATNIVGSK